MHCWWILTNCDFGSKITDLFISSVQVVFRTEKRVLSERLKLI